jgi:hypothetical protein
MLGLTNSTPTYQGNGQPQTSGGGACLAGILGYLFGSNTPAYQGNGQSTSRSGGWLGSLFSSTPGYKSAPPTITQQPPPATATVSVPVDGCPNPGVYVVIP